MFNINAPEFLVILVIALVVIGPQRLPGYAETLGRWARQLRDMASTARETVRVELGPDFEDVDWAKFDPRQYDPRRIVREALLEPSPPKSDEQTNVDHPDVEPAVAVASSAAAQGLVPDDDNSQPEDDAAEPTDPVETVNLVKPEPALVCVPYDVEAT